MLPEVGRLPLADDVGVKREGFPAGYGGLAPKASLEASLAIYVAPVVWPTPRTVRL